MMLQAEQGVVVVGEAATGAAVVDCARRAQPDVVLLDARMPVVDSNVWHITGGGPVSPPVPVLVLIDDDAEELTREALRSGASGALSTDATPDELVWALKAVADGGVWLEPAFAKALVREFASRAAPMSVAPEAFTLLTLRETEVLTLVARGLSNAEIARHLVVGTATVKTHVSRILTKLGLRDRAQAIVAAHRTGMVRADAFSEPDTAR
jgi:DNA-binding NarL/FixJ family response regulator